MTQLGDQVLKVRSKNAGPFWVTIDVFCGSASAYETVVGKLTTDSVAALFHADLAAVKRFDIADLHVVKFSIPRPVVQGSRWDRDMHGAQWACLLEEMELEP
jgi:hypothetical protein